jgi:RNA polymerase sigma factor (sigma-70 family)
VADEDSPLLGLPAGAEEEDLMWEDLFPDERLPDPLANLTREEERDEILRVLLSFSVEDRVAFTLRELDGYSAEEVAEIQKRKKEDVEQSVDGIRSRLRNELARAKGTKN